MNDDYLMQLLRNQATAPIPKLKIQTKDAVKQWVDLKHQYIALRGSKPGNNRKAIPKTTHHDVMQIVTAWSRELRKVTPRSSSEWGEHARWTACMARVAKRYDAKKPNAEYPDNEDIWQNCTKRLAVYLQSRKIVPSKWQLLKEAVFEAVAEVPNTLGHATRELASGAAGLLAEPGKLAALLLGGAILIPPLVRAFRK